MIAVDTSSLIAYLRGDEGRDVEALDQAFEFMQAALSPVVLTEVLSDPKLDSRVSRLVQELPILEIQPGYWLRAAQTRRKILSTGRRARLADSLIAQSCIDDKVPLITRDSDFRHFEQLVGLALV